MKNTTDKRRNSHIVHAFLYELSAVSENRHLISRSQSTKLVPPKIQESNFPNYLRDFSNVLVRVSDIGREKIV